jgi:elongation factor 3
MISHNEEFVGALCPEQWYVADGRVTHKGHLAVAADRFEDSSRPGSGFNSSVASSVANSVASSANASANASAANSGAEDNGEMAFRSKKKKKMTKKEKKEQEARRRLRHIEWFVQTSSCERTVLLTLSRLNSPKGTPKYPDTDEEE